ncbi:MAG: DUF4835 family protein [Bacteroidota bacterium]
MLLFRIVSAQEFNCSINVVSPQVQGTDKDIYEKMQKALYEFVNNRKWTNYAFKVEERIECTMMITISERISSDEYKGTMNLQLRRPVFNSSYNTSLFNNIDKDIQFSYIENQALDFDDNAYTSSLTSLIAYYLNFFLGLEFDTYSPKGGTVFFEKAQNIVNLSQNATEKGWKSYENQKNRYWLVENALNSEYSDMRVAMYKYHRLGLDAMFDNVDVSRSVILDALDLFKKTNNEKSGLILMQVIMYSKADELVNIFSMGSSTDKTKAYNILKEIDPGNLSKYSKITAN